MNADCRAMVAAHFTHFTASPIVFEHGSYHPPSPTSRSGHISWLCEELGIDYELNTYERSPLSDPLAYKALHHAESAPAIQGGDLTLAESGGCMEYFSREYANGELFPDQTHPSYG
jgi:glutathione S-transferase